MNGKKIYYLYPSGLTEDPDYDILKFVNAEVDFDKERMTWILSAMDDAIQHKASHEELTNLARAIDQEFHVCNSEWARIQLKIIEFLYSDVIKFDYWQNDWHLYLQIQIANWLLGTS